MEVGRRRMKIHIIGACGSGKTFIARELSKRLGIIHCQLDNLVWKRTDSNNIRYPNEIRDRNLDEIIQQDSWIIEGVQHDWVYNSFKEADHIFIIRPILFVQNLRIIKRFVKTRLRLEERNYTQDFKNVLKMFGWNKKFEQEHMVKIMKMTNEFTNKRHIIKSNLEILRLLKL
jgi:adenylate kinase family enzyme